MGTSLLNGYSVRERMRMLRVDEILCKLKLIFRCIFPTMEASKFISSLAMNWAASYRNELCGGTDRMTGRRAGFYTARMYFRW